MSLLLVNDGEQLLLQEIVGAFMTMHLYTNDVVRDKTITLAQLTECTAQGYMTTDLDPVNWRFARDPVSGLMMAVYGPVIFSFLEAVSAYGYYITTKEADGTDRLMCLDQLVGGGAFNLPSTGGNISVTARLSLL
jgi:hypothetical protein